MLEFTELVLDRAEQIERIRVGGPDQQRLDERKPRGREIVPPQVALPDLDPRLGATFPDLQYVSLEPLDVREFATEDPRGFLREYGDGVILDEVQRAPTLFPYLQEELDRDPAPGRFVLTGSQHFGLTEVLGARPAEARHGGAPLARGAGRGLDVAG